MKLIKNKIFSKLIILLSAFAIFTTSASAYNINDFGGEYLHIGGYIFTQYQSPRPDELTILGATPIIMLKPVDFLLIESEFEYSMILEKDAVDDKTNVKHEFEMGFLQADFIIGDLFTVIAGKFITPFGTYGEKVHPSWINKLSNNPIYLGHDSGFTPANVFGAQLRGAFEISYPFKVMYSFYAGSNELIDATSSGHGGDGEVEINFNFKNPALGGRVAILPFRTFEIGGSYYKGKKTVEEITGDEKTDLYAIGGDFQWQLFDQMVEIRGEVAYSNRKEEIQTVKTLGYYAQLAVRTIILPVDEFSILFDLVKSFEIIFRYSEKRDLDNTDNIDRQTSIGLNYSFARTFVLKGSVDLVEEHTGNDTLFNVQLSYGF